MAESTSVHLVDSCPKKTKQVEDKTEFQRPRPVQEQTDDQREKFDHAFNRKNAKKKDKEVVFEKPTIFAIAQIAPETPKNPIAPTPAVLTVSTRIPEVHAPSVKKTVGKPMEKMNVEPNVDGYAYPTSPYTMFQQTPPQVRHETTPPAVRKIFVALVEEVITQIAQHASKEGVRTEVVLQNPPIFRGVTLVVNEYTQARNQLHISLINLVDPEARALIFTHQASLHTVLLEKGYTLQSLVVEPTWKPAERISSSESPSRPSPEDRHHDPSRQQHPQQ